MGNVDLFTIDKKFLDNHYENLSDKNEKQQQAFKDEEDKSKDKKINVIKRQQKNL